MGRIIGAALGLAAVAVAVIDLAGPGRLRALGEWWFTLSPDSLQLLQPAIERHVARWLWDPVLLTLLEQPLAVILAVLALLARLPSLFRRRQSEF